MRAEKCTRHFIDNDSHLTWCIEHTLCAVRFVRAYHLLIHFVRMFSISASGSTTSIQTGPSGRAIAETIDPDLLNAIQEHLNMERQAHASYFAASIWFAERTLKGFSSYFREESSSEHRHAAKFAEYIIARGQSVELKAVEAPYQSWTSPADVMASAFQMEVDVTASLQQLYSMAERVSDTRTTVFLDPMVEMQTQSRLSLVMIL